MFENKPKFGPDHYTSGSDIIRQGDEPDSFYIITRGRVEIINQPPDGLDQLINELGPGDYFGEVGMMRHRRRMATVRAKTDVDVMVMDIQTFRNWIEGSPDIAAEIEAVVEQRLQIAGELPESVDQKIPTGMLAYLEEDTAEEAAGETTEQYKKGTVIIRQGDTADKFYIIINGFVTVSHTPASGQEQTIAYLTAGDYFGEIGLLDGSPRIATVTALTAVKLLSFERDIFKSWMRKSPSSQDDLKREASRRRKDTGMLSLPDE